MTIARSRKHIEQYYDTADIGKFPTRLTPISRRPDLTDLNSTVNYNDIYEIVSNLNLAIYTPSDFILPSMRDKYSKGDGDTFSNLSRAGRERGIRRLMSINLLKRLESSVNSFRLTLSRIHELISGTVKTIDNLATCENAKVEDFDLESGLDFDEQNDNVFIGGKKTQIDLRDMDYIQWREYLQADLDSLKLLLFMLADITPQHDSKLQQLVVDLRDKFNNPINGTNKRSLSLPPFRTRLFIYMITSHRS